ncbi:hypothetical protein GALMADRAFT_148068 [Galerina marginata CBS 339.88]|uniref:Uncharacterized protein n=1 Tax=Galerina marginata (strain CBS 339.88) TaxID=685588 RepID=A0A067S897_GALM3|nr:hypothetical protein GALMADRAFT_148068 [Galerina marginata CBS 339.88]
MQNTQLSRPVRSFFSLLLARLSHLPRQALRHPRFPNQHHNHHLQRREAERKGEKDRRQTAPCEMWKYGGSGSDGINIRFSLLAIVNDTYHTTSDELEFLKRERVALERRVHVLLMEERAVPEEGQYYRSTPPSCKQPRTRLRGPTAWTPREGRMPLRAGWGGTYIEILRMTHPHEAVRAWETCVREPVHAKVGLEDEFGKGVRANTHHVKRKFDDEPFIREYLQRAHRVGLLNAMMGGKRGGGSRSRSRRGRRGDHERWGSGQPPPPAPSNALPEILEDELTVKYQRIVGCLLYPAVATRPDIALSCYVAWPIQYKTNTYTDGGAYLWQANKGNQDRKTEAAIQEFTDREKMNGSIMYFILTEKLCILEINDHDQPG